jgi:hypothetical protein
MPRHVDHEVEVWRRPPGGQWEEADTTRVFRFGGVAWRWRTSSSDVDRRRPWRFRFVIARHIDGESNVVKVYVNDET